MTGKAPILSISVACYNVEAYLERAIASYSDERLRGRVEVLLVDDGSTDTTPELIQAAVKAEPHIFRAICKENGGHGSTVNSALADARGSYFRIIDGDDWVDTDELVRFCDYLEQLAQTNQGAKAEQLSTRNPVADDKAEQGSAPDLVIDVKTEINMSDGTTHVYSLPESITLSHVYNFDELCTNRAYLPYIMLHNLTVKTEMLRKAEVKLLEHTFYVDLQFVVQATLAAKTISFVDIRVYQYLVGNAAQSVADEGYVKHFDDHTRVCNALLTLYGEQIATLSSERKHYLALRCKLLVETHYNIALIFDKDRKRGLCRAQDFRKWLQFNYPEIAKATEHRYRQDRVLHSLGVNSQAGLDMLSGRVRRLVRK